VFAGAELVPTEGVIEELRRVKDAGEIDRMAEAARIADEALAAVRPLLGQGVTEREVALGLDYEMRRLGAEGSSFETIVASGPNGAKPHARPTDRRIAPGELVVIDFGAIVDGYCSDMTRTLCVGEPSDDTALRMAAVVKESQREGVAAVKAGVRGRDVDGTCRAVIAEAGWGDAFIHGTGHGVGLEIHEAPRVASTSDDVLAAGHVVTVEPGVYLAEHGGVRIEDTVVVTDEGCIVLTNAPKELFV
jgi:Xaa-Pro aminopeptidase